MYKNLMNIFVSVILFFGLTCQAADQGVLPQPDEPIVRVDQLTQRLQERLAALQRKMRKVSVPEQEVRIPGVGPTPGRGRVSLGVYQIPGLEERIAAVRQSFDAIITKVDDQILLANSPAILLTIKASLEVAREKINSCATDRSNIAKVEAMMDLVLYYSRR